MAEILSGAKIIRIQKINAYTKVVLNKIFLNTFLLTLFLLSLSLSWNCNDYLTIHYFCKSWCCIQEKWLNFLLLPMNRNVFLGKGASILPILMCHPLSFKLLLFVDTFLPLIIFMSCKKSLQKIFIHCVHENETLHGLLNDISFICCQGKIQTNNEVIPLDKFNEFCT